MCERIGRLFGQKKAQHPQQLARQRDLKRQIDADDEIDQVGDLGALAPKRLFQHDHARRLDDLAVVRQRDRLPCT